MNIYGILKGNRQKVSLKAVVLFPFVPGYQSQFGGRNFQTAVVLASSLTGITTATPSWLCTHMGKCWENYLDNFCALL